MIKFSTRLKELRLDKGMTQTQLAEILNVHFTTVKDWEVRGKQPRYETLIEISRYFGVTTDYLLGLGEEN